VAWAATGNGADHVAGALKAMSGGGSAGAAQPTMPNTMPTAVVFKQTLKNNIKKPLSLV
jgi:hypothetical protein